ncbi:MAG TPA: GNAT family N-acetyltransferase [Solirubrobacterales bacterium]|nr:GNAT family N-acetyltransferase [Solirubrobacterales bacterium]
MSSLAIRSADPERDAAACAAIYAPSVEAPTSFEETAPDAAEMAARIAQYSATHAWLVAEDGGEVVGYAYACPFLQRPAYRWTVSASVYVAAGHTGAGIGRALYEELFARLRGQGYRMAVAGITLPNPASVSLHERLGFFQTGVNRAVGWKLGAWRDVGWYQLELSPESPGAPSDPHGHEPADAAG